MLLPWEIVAAFFSAALVLAIAPGPDNIFVLTQSAMHGMRAGLVTTLGLITGLVGHTTAVALGVAVIFQTSPTAFWVLKCVGACYLLYLAWLTVRSGSAHAALEQKNFVGYTTLYRRGVIMNITNPKVSLFFLALLPQFADPARGLLTGQIFLLGGLFMLATALVFGLVAVLGGQLAHWFNNSPQYQIVINRVAALIFVGLAIALLFS